MPSAGDPSICRCPGRRAILIFMSTDVGLTVRSVDSATRPRAQPSYRSPDAGELAIGVRGLASLRRNDPTGASAALSSLGFTVTADHDTGSADPVTWPGGRPYLLAVSESGTEREWGLYLLDTSTWLRLCIAVPHTHYDENCHALALRLWRKIPGSLLMMATVHRNTPWAGHPGGVADQADEVDSLFHHASTDVFVATNVPMVQIHGCKDGYGYGAVVSTGSAHLTLPALRIADQLKTRLGTRGNRSHAGGTARRRPISWPGRTIRGWRPGGRDGRGRTSS
jgi:hypothetical protein